jgi:hypothetical protein
VAQGQDELAWQEKNPQYHSHYGRKMMKRRKTKTKKMKTTKKIMRMNRKKRTIVKMRNSPLPNFRQKIVMDPLDSRDHLLHSLCLLLRYWMLHLMGQPEPK